MKRTRKRTRKNGSIKPFHRYVWSNVSELSEKPLIWYHYEYQVPAFWNHLLHQKIKLIKSQSIHYSLHKENVIKKIDFKLTLLKNLFLLCEEWDNYHKSPLQLNGFLIPNAIVVPKEQSLTDKDNQVRISQNSWNQLWLDGQEIDFGKVTKITRPFRVWSLLQNFEYNGKWYTTYAGEAEYKSYDRLLTKRDYELYLEFKDKI